MTPQQIEELYKLSYHEIISDGDGGMDKGELILDYKDMIPFITTLLEKQREEICEMIKNHPVEINGDREQVMAGLELIEKFSGDIIELIKEK